jgi:peptidoglycan/xylan/chitin deacetylase (PgdA/CDA1 family)
MVLVAAGFLFGVVIFPSEVKVSLDGQSYRVPKGSTLAELLTIAHLHARPGSLLDVDGIAIRAAATRGRVLLNGRERSPSTILHSGNRVLVIDGADTKEALSHIVRRVGRDIADPQFRLEKLPGTETITIGTYSRKVAGVEFEAAGGPGKPEKSVALTFDDGPSPLTPHILAVLKEYKVRATFFLVGVQVQKYPELVRKEKKARMALGNHSWSHPTRPPFARLSDEKARDEIERAQQVIEDAGGKPHLFRPPGGSFSDKTTKMVKKHHLRTVLWSVDPQDWRHGRSASTIASLVLSHVRPGSIIVMHDGGGNVANTIAALPAIIKGIRAKGLHLVTLQG